MAGGGWCTRSHLKPNRIDPEKCMDTSSKKERTDLGIFSEQNVKSSSKIGNQYLRTRVMCPQNVGGGCGGCSSRCYLDTKRPERIYYMDTVPREDRTADWSRKNCVKSCDSYRALRTRGTSSENVGWWVVGAPITSWLLPQTPDFTFICFWWRHELRQLAVIYACTTLGCLCFFPPGGISQLQGDWSLS